MALAAQILVDMLRNIFAQFYYYVIPVVALILCLCLAYEQRTLSEKVKNQEFRVISKECDNEQFRLRKESILKDNKTAVIWSKLGKTENEAEKCRKDMVEKEKELSEKDEIIKKNKDARKQCAIDLKDLRLGLFLILSCV